MTEPRTIKAVVFDFFGTLVPNFSLEARTSILREMAKIVGAPMDSFMSKWFATFNERVTGVFPDVASNIRAICSEFGIEPSKDKCIKAVDKRIDYERQHITPRSSAENTLRELRKRGYKTGLISDCSSELPLLWKQTIFEPLFDVTIFSCLVGIKKPNPEIFLLASRELEVNCESCIYVGDGGSRELSGAAYVGMHPFLLRDTYEQNNADTHRVDAEEWQGPTIIDLKELLLYLDTDLWTYT